MILHVWFMEIYCKIILIKISIQIFELSHTLRKPDDHESCHEQCSEDCEGYWTHSPCDVIFIFICLFLFLTELIHTYLLLSEM